MFVSLCESIGKKRRDKKWINKGGEGETETQTGTLADSNLACRLQGRDIGRVTHVKDRNRNDSREHRVNERWGRGAADRAGVNGLPVIPAAHTDSHTAAVWAGANPSTQQPQRTTGAATVFFSLPLEISLTPAQPKHTAVPTKHSWPILVLNSKQGEQNG